MPMEATEDGCEEQAIMPFAVEVYFPCNKPATTVVGWPHRPGERDLRMCDFCAYHNLKNRGAKLIAAYVPVRLQEIPE